MTDGWTTLRDGFGMVVLVGMVTAATLWGGVLG